MNWVNGAKIFSIINIKEGFYKIRIAKGNK